MSAKTAACRAGVMGKEKTKKTVPEKTRKAIVAIQVSASSGALYGRTDSRCTGSAHCHEGTLKCGHQEHSRA